MLQNPLKGFYVKPVLRRGSFCEQSCFVISKDCCGQTLYVFIIICPEVMGVYLLCAE